MPSLHNRPLNILLVEDDDGDAKAMQRAFLKAPIPVSIKRAVDGVEALRLLRGPDEQQPTVTAPLMLITDLNMPRINGIQLIEAIRGDRDLKRSIVFILTTSKRDEDLAAAYDQNVAGYILKAKAGQDFQELVRLIGCYRCLVELPE